MTTRLIDGRRARSLAIIAARDAAAEQTRAQALLRRSHVGPGPGLIWPGRRELTRTALFARLRTAPSPEQGPEQRPEQM